MPVVSVTEQIRNIDGEVAEGGERRYLRMFFVEVDSYDDGAIVAELAPGIPRLFDSYVRGNEFDASAFCRRVAASPGESPLIWEVRAEFSTKAAKQRDSQQAQRDTNLAQERATPEDPLARRTVVRFSASRHTRVLEKDFSDPPKVVANSAGQPFDPPVEVEYSLPVVTFTRNEATFDAARQLKYFDKVNSDAFLGAQPGQVKCLQITAVSQFENNREFYEVTYEFEFNPEGWILKVLDQGRMRIADPGDDNPNYPHTLTPILDANKDPVCDPVLLNGTGGEMYPGAETTYLDFKQFKTEAFSVLNLP